MQYNSARQFVTSSWTLLDYQLNSLLLVSVVVCALVDSSLARFAHFVEPLSFRVPLSCTQNGAQNGSRRLRTGKFWHWLWLECLDQKCTCGAKAAAGAALLKHIFASRMNDFELLLAISFPYLDVERK
jgi:hypothetical protein